MWQKRPKTAPDRMLSRYYPRVILILLGLLLAACLLVGVRTAAAQDVQPEGAGYYMKDGQTFELVVGKDAFWIGTGLSPSELEALFPMSPEKEQAIVHVIPQCPVVIDGVTYKPEDISLFNGHRLRFAEGDDGTLYAFTTAAGLEDFLAEQNTGQRSDPFSSIFYKNWMYGGDIFTLNPGYGLPDLDPIDFNDAISSTKISTYSSAAYLFEDIGLSGDYFYMSPGSNHTGRRLMVAMAAPVSMLVAPGPMEEVQAKVCRRFFILA